jgi:hypothetical protein
MDTFESYDLLPFALEGQINLGEKRGLIKIYRSDDDHIILFRNSPYVSPSTTESTPHRVADIDAARGFVLDIGIRRTKWLARGGFYFGQSLVPPQSRRKVTQADYDADLFDWLVSALDRHYQSDNSESESLALRTNYLLQAYNNSRILFPSFHNESYLGLLRIVDAITKSWSADEFALSAAEISPALNREVYEKVAGVAAYQQRRLDLAEQVATTRCSENHVLRERIQSLEKQARLTFSCLYSAYQYRNKFVHLGLPFPNTVTLTVNSAEDSGMNYLNPVEGISFIKRQSSGGVKTGDLFDIHSVVADVEEAARFRDLYFKLLPTWHFLKRVAREAILIEFKRIAGS